MKNSLCLEREERSELLDDSDFGHTIECPKCKKRKGRKHPDGRVQFCETCNWALEAEISSLDYFDEAKNEVTRNKKERMMDKTRFSNTCTKCHGTGNSHTNNEEAYEIPCLKCRGMGSL